MAAPKGETLLADAIRSGQFAPVYCLYGENEFRKDEAVRQMISAATEEATREFNLDVLRGPETDEQTLEVSVSTLPMMSERRMVVLRDPAGLKKRSRAALERYLENPSPETVLVLVAPAGSDVPDTIAGRATLVELENLTGERLKRWIAKQAKSVYGVEIDPDAAELLQQVVGLDLVELAGELDKLASYCGGRRIDTDGVIAVVGVRPGETMIDLVDAVSARDVRRSLALVAPVLRQPKVSGVSAIMSLTVHVLGIGWCCARRNAGIAARNIEREVFPIARRVPFFLAMRAAGANATAWTRASGHWTAADVNTALEALLAADIALKQTGVASDEQLVSTAVLAVCAGADRAPAAA